MKKAEGFTLIEVIIALAIFSLVSIVAYKGIDQLIKTKNRLDQENHKWQQLVIFFDQFESDIRQHIDRPVRNSQGQTEPAWLAKPSFSSPNDAQIMLSRLGDPQQTGYLMDGRRVGYRLNQGAVEIVLWPSLDLAESVKPEIFKMVDGVSDFSLTYLNQHGKWVKSWPDNSSQDTPINYYPRAVLVKISLTSGEFIYRVFAL